MSPRRRIALPLLLVLLAVVAVPASAQTTGSVAGRVTDEDGGVLPGVTVEARSPASPGDAHRDHRRHRDLPAHPAAARHLHGQLQPSTASPPRPATSPWRSTRTPP